MILSKALNSARALRSSKNTAVCSAETFSATAVAMNWFMLVPSSLLNRSTAFLSDFGSRRGYVFVSVICQPPYFEFLLSLLAGATGRRQIATEQIRSRAHFAFP